MCFDTTNKTNILFNINQPGLSTTVRRQPTTRYHALRIGPFADVYEWLTASHLEKGDTTAALASAEKANEIFVGWGRPYGHYARVLAGMDRR